MPSTLYTPELNLVPTGSSGPNGLADNSVYAFPTGSYGLESAGEGGTVLFTPRIFSFFQEGQITQQGGQTFAVKNFQFFSINTHELVDELTAQTEQEIGYTVTNVKISGMLSVDGGSLPTYKSFLFEYYDVLYNLAPVPPLTEFAVNVPTNDQITIEGPGSYTLLSGTTSGISRGWDFNNVIVFPTGGTLSYTLRCITQPTPGFSFPTRNARIKGFIEFT